MMIKHIVLIVVVIAVFGGLGAFINPAFYLGIMLMCPAMHFLMGCDMHDKNKKKVKKCH